MTSTTRQRLETLDIALAMAERLPEYVQTGEVFRPITIDHGDRVHHVTMTLGGLLQRLYGPRARGDEDDRLARADLLLDEARQLPGYGEQLRRELRSNLNLWRAALEDLSEGEGVGGWATAAGHRTRIALLMEEAEALELDLEAQEDLLASADSRARLLLEGSAFIGGEEEAELYGKDAFWWLWSQPRAR